MIALNFEPLVLNNYQINILFPVRTWVNYSMQISLKLDQLSMQFNNLEAKL